MSVLASRIFKVCKIRSISCAGVRYSSTSHIKDGNKSDSHKHKDRRLLYYIGATGLAAGAFTAYICFKDEGVSAREYDSKYGLAISTLPTYKMDEVRKHSETKSGIWVTYKHGVYDITKFISQHPGGEKIMMAAGGALEPFWQLYAVHKRSEVFDMLESYRIGNLSDDDVEAVDTSDPYGRDPRRHPALKPRSITPYNAEPPPDILVDNFLTPQDLFYVRNHLPVPDIDEKTHEVEISGVGVRTRTLRMSDIKKLPKVTITAAMQCAGNRRSEMTRVKEVKGLSWGQAAIGNATWSGARLSDILKQMGVDYTTKAQHVQFEGLDLDPSSTPYGASIPIEKALDPRGDVILAYEMNGEPLSRDHGAPLRVVVPGVTGARNVKWLGRIIISKEESDSHWQQNDYKGFSPSVDWDTVDFTKSPAIQELPVTSAICTPSHGEAVRPVNNTIPVKGYAWSGGGRKIVRVDVSCDRGKTWHVANFTQQDSNKHPYHWAWTLWSIDLPLNSKSKECEIWVKAVDSTYNTQPETFENIWNLRGVLSNAYHRVTVNIR